MQNRIAKSEDIVRKAMLNRVKTAIAQAYIDTSELKRKIALRKVLRQMRLAALVKEDR